VVEHPALASDRWGNLALTWSERDHLQDASSNILVKRWNGETWAEFREGDAEGGGISNTSLYSHDPHMAIDSIGLPTVVWVERETTFQRRSHIHVRSWDGEDWIEAGPNSASGMGISGSNGRNPTQPDIGIDAAGRPVVAWVNGNLNNQNQYDESNIFVRRRSGLTWEELGLHSATGGGISNSQRVSEAPSVAFDEEDRVIVAWEEVREFIPGAPFLLEIDIYVRRFDGVAWTELGMGSATGRGVTRDVDGLNTNPSISMNVSGDPILTWENLNYTGSLNREIRVRRFDGTAWVDEFGEAVPGSFLSEEDDFTYSHVSRADAQGGLTVAWRRWNLDTGESTLFAARNSGESWFEIGEGSALGAGVLFR
jgi:hypothetical protein